MRHWADNSAIIRRRWPGVLEMIEGAAPVEARITDRTPERTLFIDGIHLTSSYNRLGEARLQARVIPCQSETATVYGFALGDLQRVLLERPAIVQLDVVVLSTSATHESLARFEHADWLADPRVTLIHGGETDTVRKPFALAPATLRLADRCTERLRDQIVLEVSAPFQKRHFAREEAWLDECLQRNADLRADDGDVRELFGSQPGGTALVIAGGPTLGRFFGWIRANRRDKTVVCVSTALKPLLGAGVVPDVVVVVDASPKVLDHFTGIDPGLIDQTPLVYLADMYDEVLRAWPGPRLVTYFRRSRYRELLEADPKGSLHCSGTVTHAAVDLAVQMGCSRVILFGADFCHAEGKSHVDGAAHPHRVPDSPSVLRVVNGLGQRIPTATCLLGYLRDLESYIARRPSVEFIKAGRQGAPIQGAAWLEEADADVA
jgi:hypothetical protein